MPNCFSGLLFHVVVASALSIALRGQQQRHLPGPPVPAVLMPGGVMACPSGQRITTQHSCTAAFEKISAVYDYESADPDNMEASLVSMPHFPRGCSVSKGRAYFNTNSAHLFSGDSAVGTTLSFQVVCAPAAYSEVAHSRFCKGNVLYNGGGVNAAGRFQDFASCKRSCDEDPRCNFFLWKSEAQSTWVYHCATFTGCDRPEVYMDGKTATLYKKLDDSAPAQVATNEPDSPIHFQSLGVTSVAGPKVEWFACQLVGGQERVVWTSERIVTMTRSKKKHYCPGNVNCFNNRSYSGSWSIDDAYVKWKWDDLPPMRLTTVDGGRTFAFESHGQVRKYSCTSPPLSLANLIKAGILEAQKKLAAEQRTKAALPTDYTQHGCLLLPAAPIAPLVSARSMTLGKCFSHCAKMKGVQYFSVTRGDSCFCSTTAPGEPADQSRCDLTCTGSRQQYCGGFGLFANVYTMVDCLPANAQELKEERAAKLARLHGMYQFNASQTCGQAKGNEVEVAGSKHFAGKPSECEQICYAAYGAGKCHGFTYNAKSSRCSFHLDAFWGKPTKDRYTSCYYKKAVPVIGQLP